MLPVPPRSAKELARTTRHQERQPRDWKNKADRRKDERDCAQGSRDAAQDKYHENKIRKTLAKETARLKACRCFYRFINR